MQKSTSNKAYSIGKKRFTVRASEVAGVHVSINLKVQKNNHYMKYNVKTFKFWSHGSISICKTIEKELQEESLQCS